MVLMVGLIIVLVVIVAGLVGYMVWAGSTPKPGTSSLDDRPPTDEEVLQARLDLHRVQRRLDVRLAQHEQRQAADRLRREIAEVLGGTDDRP